MAITFPMFLGLWSLGHWINGRSLPLQNGALFALIISMTVGFLTLRERDRL
jgi:hypothetical protein